MANHNQSLREADDHKDILREEIENAINKFYGNVSLPVKAIHLENTDSNNVYVRCEVHL